MGPERRESLLLTGVAGVTVAPWLRAPRRVDGPRPHASPRRLLQTARRRSGGARAVLPRPPNPHCASGRGTPRAVTSAATVPTRPRSRCSCSPFSPPSGSRPTSAGAVGRGLDDGFGTLFGQVRYAVPVVCVVFAIVLFRSGPAGAPGRGGRGRRGGRTRRSRRRCASASASHCWVWRSSAPCT